MSENNKNQIIIFKTEDEKISVDVRFDAETVWLTNAQIAQMFERDRSVISKHINNVFIEKELKEKSNVQILHIPNSDKPVNFYSPDMMISIGYCVNLKQNSVVKDFFTTAVVVKKGAKTACIQFEKSTGKPDVSKLNAKGNR